MKAARMLACLAGAALVLPALPASALEPVKMQETAANLAMLKTLLGSRADVTFTSDLPGAAEGADVLTAFGQTKRGEAALINGAANLQRLEPVKEIAFYNDQALTVFSDLVVYYEDDRFREAFGFSSDRAPEPATWALMLTGMGALGAALRRRRAVATVLGLAVLAVGVSGPAAADPNIVMKRETAQNVANIKALLSATANVTFQSDLPGGAETTDTLKAFGRTDTGELGALTQVGFDFKTKTLADAVTLFDDAGMTRMSDEIDRYVDAAGRESFVFASDADTPEPATWALFTLGALAAGAALRRARRRAIVPHPAR